MVNIKYLLLSFVMDEWICNDVTDAFLISFKCGKVKFLCLLYINILV